MPTLVQHAFLGQASDVSSQAVSFTSQATAGNAILVGVAIFDASSPGTITVTDNNGNPYTQDASLAPAENSDQWLYIFSSPNITSTQTTTTVTVHLSGVTGQPSIGIQEWSGMATSSLSDGSANAKQTSNATSVTSGSITTTNAIDVLFAVATNDAATSAWSAGTGFTLDDKENDGNTHEPCGVEHEVLSSTGTYTASINFGTSTTGAILVVAYKGTSGSSTPVSVSDSGSGSDSIPQIGLHPTDSGSGIDTIPSLSVTVGTQTDSGTGSDAVTVGIPLTDSGAGADTILTLNVIITDSGTGDDSLLTVLLALTDSGAGTDSISVNTGATPIILTDSGAGADALILGVTIPLMDSGVGSDTLGLLLSLADSGSGTDSLEDIVLSLLDTALGSDAVGNLLATLSLSDAGLGGETMTATGQQFFSLFDQGTGMDVLLWAGPAPINVRINTGVRLTQNQDTSTRPQPQITTGTRRTD